MFITFLIAVIKIPNRFQEGGAYLSSEFKGTVYHGGKSQQWELTILGLSLGDRRR